MNPYVEESSSNELQESSTSAIVSRAMRLFRIMLLRKKIIIACLVLSSLVGAYKYATAIPMYSSSAQILILNSGGDQDQNANSQSMLQRQIPTYLKLFSSEVVTKKAAKQIPPQFARDFGSTPPEEWYKILQQNMSVVASRNTSMLNLQYRSRDPETAAVIVNEILSAYREYMISMQSSQSKKPLELYHQELQELDKKIALDQKKMEQMQSEAKLLITSGEDSQSVLTSQVSYLRESLNEAQKSRLQMQSTIKSLKQAIANQEDVGPFAEPILGAQAALQIFNQEFGFRDRFQLSRLQEKLDDDEVELKMQSEKLGNNHPQVKELVDRINKTKINLQKQLNGDDPEIQKRRNQFLTPRLLRAAQQRLTESIEKEKAIQLEYNVAEKKALAANEKMFQIQNLKKNLERDQARSEWYMQRISELSLDSKLAVQTEVVSLPSVPTSPFSPNKTRIAFFSIVMGLALGVVLVIVIEAIDDRFQSPDEIKYQLGVPVLAMVRKMEETGGHAIDAVQAFVKPNGVECEAFRTLRTAITFSNQETRRLLVTSTEQSDGKTTVMANLAVAFAQSGKRTLIIDADLRRPGLTTLMELRKSEGLSQLMRSEEPIEEAVLPVIQPTGAPNLDIIPAGSRPVNPAELLAADRLSDLLSWAETVYDQILIDAPPILAVSDAGIIGRLTDSLILVMRPDKNRRRMVYRSIESLKMFGIQLVGVVVNHLTPEQGGDYYGYGYGYGYNEGYGNEHDDEHDFDPYLTASSSHDDSGYEYDHQEYYESGYEEDGYGDYHEGYEDDGYGYESTGRRAA